MPKGGLASLISTIFCLTGEGRLFPLPRGAVEPCFAVTAIVPNPAPDRSTAQSAFLPDHRNRDALFNKLLNYLKLEIRSIPLASLRELPFPAALLYTLFWFHDDTPFENLTLECHPISLNPGYHKLVARTEKQTVLRTGRPLAIQGARYGVRVLDRVETRYRPVCRAVRGRKWQRGLSLHTPLSAAVREGICRSQSFFFRSLVRLVTNAQNKSCFDSIFDRRDTVTSSRPLPFTCKRRTRNREKRDRCGRFLRAMTTDG